MEEVSLEQKEKLKDEIQGKLQGVEEKMQQKLEGMEILGHVLKSDFAKKSILLDLNTDVRCPCDWSKQGSRPLDVLTIL